MIYLINIVNVKKKKKTVEIADVIMSKVPNYQFNYNN